MRSVIISQVRPSIYLANMICLWSALGNELIIPVNSSYSSSSFDNNIRTWSFMPASALRPVKLSSFCKTLARCSSISISANNMRYALSLSFIGDFCFTGSPPFFIRLVFWAILCAGRNRLQIFDCVCYVHSNALLSSFSFTNFVVSRLKLRTMQHITIYLCHGVIVFLCAFLFNVNTPFLYVYTPIL